MGKQYMVVNSFISSLLFCFGFDDTLRLIQIFVDLYSRFTTSKSNEEGEVFCLQSTTVCFLENHFLRNSACILIFLIFSNLFLLVILQNNFRYYRFYSSIMKKNHSFKQEKNYICR